MLTHLKFPYHLVTLSPWAMFSSLGAFLTTTGTVMSMHSYLNAKIVLILGFTLIIFSMIVWWRDVIREATFIGDHTEVVQYGLYLGMILFIVSEVMFFFAFFWAFFSASLAPTIEVGAIWPPIGIYVLSAWEIPLLNTLILLLSGSFLTWSHHALLAKSRQDSILGLIFTILLAFTFTFLQGLEYMESTFTIADSVYGSTFFMATGFHGFHVIIGTIMLLVTLIRLINYHFTSEHHVGFEAAAWYWHFVDVVWLFLFVSIYWWGGISI